MEANTLGLNFTELNINDPSPQPESRPEQAADGPAAPDATAATAGEPREKKKPYINPQRVNTGGSQRDKLSEEALTERMARMKEQNEKIKQRRLDVIADEDMFKKTQESERIKQAQNRQMQAKVDRTREENAKRKLAKSGAREWDSDKPAAADWKKRAEDAASAAPDQDASPSDARGGRGGRGPAGRGRGRGGSTRNTPVTSPTSETPPAVAASPATAATPAPAATEAVATTAA